MVQLVVTIIFLVSVLAIVFILYRKIPFLVQLPENGSHGLSKGKYILEAEKKLEKFIKLFTKQIILHKFLSWVRIMTLKVEARIDSILHGIRKKAQQLDNEAKNKK